MSLVELNGIQVDPKKIEAIIDWSRPIIVTEMKSFSRFNRLLQENRDKVNSRKYQV